MINHLIDILINHFQKNFHHNAYAAVNLRMQNDNYLVCHLYVNYFYPYDNSTIYSFMYK